MTGVVLNRLQTNQPDFDARLRQLFIWQESQDESLSATVRKVIHQVRTQGDSALLAYVREFEDATVGAIPDLKLTPDDCQAALDRLSATERNALLLAADRIRQYHEHQREKSWQYQDEFGNLLGQRIGALERVGFYVPGGQASYPSSVLMSMIPAQVAGVDELIMVSPAPHGKVSDLVLAAAAIAGAHCCYTCGGAHAIAALAYGTESIPKVDKIVGPGGIYVIEAKRQVFGRVGIDMIAGPSEVMIISDGHAAPDMLALDLLAQAEHDASSQALIISPDATHLDEVAEATVTKLAQMPRADIIRNSLTQRGALIQCRDLVEAAGLANQIAPEHLELAVHEPETLLPSIRHAGAIFLGAGSPEVFGDYVAGPSHVLPTYGAARFHSPLGVYDFIKRSSIIGISTQGSAALTRTAAVLARGEGLEAHACSAEVRQPDSNQLGPGKKVGSA